MTRSVPLSIGESAPWFHCANPSIENYAFDTVAGRYVVISFYGSANDPECRELLDCIESGRSRFNDIDLCFFGVSVDPQDAAQKRVADSLPRIRHFWDFDRAVSKLYGAQASDGRYRQITYILDPALRVLAVLPMNAGGAAHAEKLFAILDRLPKLPPPYRAGMQAPVLVVPRIFEPKLCQALIDYYGAQGGEESGFMRDVDGKTKMLVDHRHKRRRDCSIEDEALRKACMTRIHDRLVPQIHKAFQFHVTRMERYIISCYDAAESGHFRAHRDNTTKGTAHRRFAVSLFLNTGAFESGHLRFPEFGSALYSAPLGRRSRVFLFPAA